MLNYSDFFYTNCIMLLSAFQATILLCRHMKGAFHDMNHTDKQTVSTEKEMLLDQDRAFLWHHMAPHNDHPAIFTESDNVYLTDIDGNSYIDGMAGLWCVNVGHGRTSIAEAAAKQLSTMPYTPMTNSHKPAIQLAAKLNDWLDGHYRIFFSNSGSDANEVAFKIARQYFTQTGKPKKYKFISRYRAYHGNSMGALGATGQADRKASYEPVAEGFRHAAPPYCYRCPFGKEPDSCSLECASSIEQTIVWEGADTVAGVIVEPVITGGGVITPPESYLQKVQEICQKHDVLLIVDEVICGFGRSGEAFGHKNFGVQPDIVTMAKGITSAYAPLSATAVSNDLYESFKSGGPQSHFRHVNTFGGSPMSCAVALENIDILEREDLVAKAKNTGSYLREQLESFYQFPSVGDIRTFGLMAGIELVTDKTTKDPAPPEFMQQVLGYCKQHGVMIGKNSDTVPEHNNVLTISPPFIISHEQIDTIVATLREAITSASPA